ncbi:glycoside hydrolase family 108 protein [Bradyrhizobium sp. HKCCYLS2038]|uniref:glycoside hydrolase family 108 protein n=1 Tax=Bradyrhizobium sp. HKCCYLS2038 TaxID=3420764 RepID=UPI003EC06316
MAASTYDEALRRLLLHEGGYTNHPSDPGGPTNYGITIADYRRYVQPNATAADVRAMTLDEAKAIYRRRYWDAQRCDELPGGVDYSILDYGVNSGISRSGKVLRRIVGLPDHTHLVTDEVLHAVAGRDPRALINAVNVERLAFLKSLKTWPVFGRGWARRVDDVNSASLRMTSNGVPASATFRPNTPAPHIAQAPGKGVVPAPAGMRKLIVGAGAAAPVAAGGGFIGWIIAHPFESAALGCGVALAVGGSLSALNRRYRSQQDAATPATPIVPELTTA